mmetsp:Transcript_24153/g.33128  ORF Transcript_24153/g.33128 Transcript_24153/m.33128 type:complete len:240 (-) Transcript_24153:42-761(-)|eukprot:CAMPEP_0201492854 /NCGR_PEP_ID=MMETSP0151_2-20130828/35014_1 /ASSEMBLY_ACC=CAM_ASM_000257 /TAXON_ID=200890 /ORGANISM="Paramoeba atlantica, Strain 621/1 / CCAP 1560/9" /LENGTH=239 /DNA_ID=CAMNT_0047879903 /DNA_START=150 /DNA_END=869 /DNA_ORIENTATION=-
MDVSMEEDGITERKKEKRRFEMLFKEDEDFEEYEKEEEEQEEGERKKRELRFAVVCASNMNRSMEAHSTLLKKNFRVWSFGISPQVKLPGPSLNQPNIYDFGTPYAEIRDKLHKKDPNLYRQNGVLNMLAKNAAIKTCPERFQEQNGKFDIIVAFEGRVYDAIIEDLSQKGSKCYELVHIFNLPTKDTHEEAVVGASMCLKLCEMLRDRGVTWDNNIDDLIENFISSTGHTLHYSPMFY